jgi:KipI family sensor histidine kinase inhibitor
MGPNAVLVDDVAGDPARWSLALRALDVPGVIDVVPAARTVLVRCADASALAVAVPLLGEVIPDGSIGVIGEPEVTIPVDYHGDDLASVAAAVGCSVDDVVALHSGARYEVAFCGFAPGFAYLRGLPAALHLPRRATPRTRVPAGSVAIAAEYSAVYPSPSPGGWHLLGSTRRTMFDVGRDPPALLVPGTTVRFEAR